MASIQILNLYSAGSEFFQNSENFMTELVESELSSINGGTRTPIPYSPWCVSILRSWLCEPKLPHPFPTLPPKL